MNTHQSSKPEHLRADAEQRIRSGTAPSTAGWAAGPEALALLYRLASDPETSLDALKLLHELQTHQVELDLQNAQLLESELELERRMGHFQSLYDEAPAAYVVIGQDGRISRANRTACKLFGLSMDQLQDHRLSSLLSPASRSIAVAALEAATADDSRESVPVMTKDERSCVMVAGKAPDSDDLLTILIPALTT